MRALKRQRENLLPRDTEWDKVQLHKLRVVQWYRSFPQLKQDKKEAVETVGSQAAWCL